MIITVPLKIRSEANIFEHWAVKYGRRKKNLKLIQKFFPKKAPELPCQVTLTRIAPRKLDYDNLVYAMKYIRDFIADQITPGLAPGRADDIDGLSFVYNQKKGLPKEYALEIHFQHPGISSTQADNNIPETL